MEETRGNMMNTERNVTKEPIFIKNNCLSFTIIPLLKVKKIEVKNEEVRRSRIVQLRAVTPANNSFR